MTALEKAARASAHAMHLFYNGEACSDFVWASLDADTQASFIEQARAILLAVQDEYKKSDDGFMRDMAEGLSDILNEETK